MVVAGILNKQIAAELGTSESAVKVQRSRLLEKMQEASLVELIKMIEKVKAPAESLVSQSLRTSSFLPIQKYQHSIDSPPLQE